LTLGDIEHGARGHRGAFAVPAAPRDGGDYEAVFG
jgi:hypothetical protein